MPDRHNSYLAVCPLCLFSALTRCNCAASFGLSGAALKCSPLEPSDALYVGDSEVDILTARNAGLPCISVTWGFRDVDVLKAAGADVLINNPLELLDYVGEKP